MYSARRNADPTSRLIELTAKKYKKEKIEAYMCCLSISLSFYFSEEIGY